MEVRQAEIRSFETLLLSFSAKDTRSQQIVKELAKTVEKNIFTSSTSLREYYQKMLEKCKLVVNKSADLTSEQKKAEIHRIERNMVERAKKIQSSKTKEPPKPVANIQPLAPAPAPKIAIPGAPIMSPNIASMINHAAPQPRAPLGPHHIPTKQPIKIQSKAPTIVQNSSSLEVIQKYKAIQTKYKQQLQSMKLDMSDSTVKMMVGKILIVLRSLPTPYRSLAGLDILDKELYQYLSAIAKHIYKESVPLPSAPSTQKKHIISLEEKVKVKKEPTEVEIMNNFESVFPGALGPLQCFCLDSVLQSFSTGSVAHGKKRGVYPWWKKEEENEEILQTKKKAKIC